MSEVPKEFFIGIVDLSHHQAQTIDWGAYVKGGGVAVIHKATESLTFKDEKYRERKKAAKDAGLLWGAYHFAGDVEADGAAQADHFLRFSELDDSDLMSFDCERHGTLKQMEAFVSRIQAKTGRLPVIYGRRLLRDLMRGVNGSIVSQCALWYDDYPPDQNLPRPPLPNGWTDWTLWQFTDGENGPTPYEAPGIGRSDRNAFKGTVNELRAAWPLSLPLHPELVSAG